MEKLSDITATLRGAQLNQAKAEQLIATIKSRIVKPTPMATKNDLDQAMLSLMHFIDEGRKMHSYLADRIGNVESMAARALDLACMLEANRPIQ